MRAKPLAFAGSDRLQGPLPIVQLSGVVPEREFVHVAMQVLLAHAVERPVEVSCSPFLAHFV